jgi:hypothetical protein
MSLQSLSDRVRQATDYQCNKKILREQIQADLLIPHGDGLFEVSVELIAFLATWDQDTIYLEDHYGNPVECNRVALLESCKQQYQRVMNRWHVQHEQLRQIRKI